uniref:Uncharacterized protein n=1 Tax=Avena sativa TaxID=4498 RepID=A0ACD5ZRF7_AVESA
MEDVVDKFLVSMEDPPLATDNSHMLRRLMGKMAGFFKKGKTRRQTSKAIRDINNEVQELANRRGRYSIDNIVVSKPATIDPRLRALYTEVKELIGIDGKRDQELIKLLSLGNDDDASKKKLKIVSVCGFGGLGKTTLARAVYSKIKAGFDCWAFVPVGRNPDVKKVLRDILIDFGNSVPNLMILDERQLIEVIRAFLKNKRYAY